MRRCKMGKQLQHDRASQLFHSSWKLQKHMRYLIRKTALKNGVTIPQYTILMFINQHDHITQKEIREKTLLPKSTLSKAIDGLVQQNLLVRKQVKNNRREVELFVSDKGQKFISTIFSQENRIHYLFYQAIESLSDEQFRQLLRTHEQVISYFQKQGIDK